MSSQEREGHYYELSLWPNGTEFRSKQGKLTNTNIGVTMSFEIELGLRGKKNGGSRFMES